jgi:dihydrofolate reductase
MRLLKYYVATTVDGYIARDDGSTDFFSYEGEHVTDYLDYWKQVDIVLMGRKTYEVGLKLGVTNPYPTMKQYVFSRTMKESPDPNVEIISENAGEFVRQLKQAEGKDVWLCGAGDFAATLFKEKLIDEVIIKLNPILIGSGLKVTADLGQAFYLELYQTKQYDNNILLLKYRVNY